MRNTHHVCVQKGLIRMSPCNFLITNAWLLIFTTCIHAVSRVCSLDSLTAVKEAINQFSLEYAVLFSSLCMDLYLNSVSCLWTDNSCIKQNNVNTLLKP